MLSPGSASMISNVTGNGWRLAVTRWQRNRERLLGAVLAIMLTACTGAMIVGSGCDAYAEARLQKPSRADLAASPVAVAAWINHLDARMTAVCRP
jgi:maleate cis-trans isomerase